MKYPLKSEIYDVDVFNNNFKELDEKIDNRNIECTNNLATAINTLRDYTDSKYDDVTSNYQDYMGENIAVKQNKYCYVVAAYNTNATDKAKADIICTQYNAQVKLQQIIDKMSAGGNIKLLAGDYLLSESIYVKKSINIEGCGNNTKLYCSDSQGSGTPIVINADDVYISKLSITSANYKSGSGYIKGNGDSASEKFNNNTAYISLISSNTGFNNVTLRDLSFSKEINTTLSNNAIIRVFEGKQMENLIVDCCKFKIDEESNYVKCIDYNGGGGSLILSNCICNRSLKVNLSSVTAFLNNSFNVETVTY